MKQFYLFLFLFTLFVVVACTDNQQTAQLTKREQALLDRERQFARKEAEYRSLLRMRDSLLAQKDTTAHPTWPETVAGTWSSKLICKESNCTEYVVGDQRSELWDFTDDSTGMYTKVINNNQINRIFNGNFRNELVSLTYRSDSTIQKHVEMQVTLTPSSPDLMKGTQLIQIDSGCTANFSVELVRVSNK